MRAKGREEGEGNRRIINSVYGDFWEDKLHVERIIPKHFEIHNDILASEHTIAYINVRC